MSLDTIRDLTAGTIGGIGQVLVGQPFDIVKVRMQTAPEGTYSGMLHCAGGILKNEGALAFYKGTVPPLLGIGACVSIQFGALESTKRYLLQKNEVYGRTSLSDGQIALSGCIAGLANGLVSGPVEHIRIRLQTQPDKAPIYTGPIDAVRKIHGAHGIAGIYKGQTVTFFREAIGYAAYFFTYEKLIQREMKERQIQRNELNLGMSIAYGAAAGYALWAVIYPIDVIKSRMQTDGFSALDGQKYKTTLDCIRIVFRTEGFSAFFRGLTPTLIRSPFANGATFLGYEIGARILNS